MRTKSKTRSEWEAHIMRRHMNNLCHVSKWKCVHQLVMLVMFFLLFPSCHFVCTIFESISRHLLSLTNIIIIIICPDDYWRSSSCGRRKFSIFEAVFGHLLWPQKSRALQNNFRFLSSNLLVFLLLRSWISLTHTRAFIKKNERTIAIKMVRNFFYI